MPILVPTLVLVLTACHASHARIPAPVLFAAVNGETIAGDLYGAGLRGVVIIGHGGYSTRTSWASAAQRLAEARFRVLVFDSRAAAELTVGKETPCLYDEACQADDVLAAVRYLRNTGVTTIAAIGGSLGGGAVARASADPKAGIDRIVLLAPSTGSTPESKSRKLFITTRNDANSAGLRLPGIQAMYDRTAQPKKFVLLEGSAHGQNIFLTEDRELVMDEIVRFLSEP